MEKRTVTANSRFGRLVVLGIVRVGKFAKRVKCVCDCGVEVLVKPCHLLSGNNKSCGCLKRSVLGEATRKHGHANSHVTGYKSRAYGIWQAMRGRCSNTNRSDYKYYGGRGIVVCARWQVFENFFADMGDPPEGHTLDRVDNTKGYSPDNCRWATRREQIYNSRRVIAITYKGETHSVTEWCSKLGIKRSIYYYRRKKGAEPLVALGLLGDCK